MWVWGFVVLAMGVVGMRLILGLEVGCEDGGCGLVKGSHGWWL